MPELRGLEGVSRPITINRYATSPSSAIATLRSDGAATAAGDTGALTVWRDDNGVLRSAFMRRMVTLDSATHESIADLRAWLLEWWPRLGR